MRFEWDDSSSDIGHYDGYLYDEDQKLEEISFIDYTCKWAQENDRKNGYTRPYSFVVHYCNGWSMKEGFDGDEHYRSHTDEDGHIIGGYQGNCTHTVKDIKRWCEEWLARSYIKGYESMLANLKDAKRRAEWFIANGYDL